MDWQRRAIAPKPAAPPKVPIRYPCPGLCRFVGMVCSLTVMFGIYYGGTALFGMEPLNWAAPAWTAKHVALAVVSILLGGLACLIGFGYTMTIDVRNERLNDLFIVLWQFLANGSMIWLFMIGIAMSMALGQEEAKAAVLNFGAMLAIIHVVSFGGIIGLLMGFAFFLAPIIHLPFIAYLALSEAISLFLAYWHFDTYGIGGHAWLVAGLIAPILLLLIAPSMIERDRRQRRLVMEQLL